MNLEWLSALPNVRLVRNGDCSAQFTTCSESDLGSWPDNQSAQIRPFTTRDCHTMALEQNHHLLEEPLGSEPQREQVLLQVAATEN